MDPKQILQAFHLALEHHYKDEAWQLKKQEGYIKNKWFEVSNIDKSLDNWLQALQVDNATQWLSKYPIPPKYHGKKLGIIMAGNIPLVGMHDLMCGLVAGYQVIVKSSSEDEVLPKFWVKKAVEVYPELAERIIFSDQLKGIDAAIATGSNNSARYFEYYFRNIPHLLRKNRNSVSVLTGKETHEDFLGFGHDVFDYFGLGCRNVTHLLLPQGYTLNEMLETWEPTFMECINHNKYANNYNYHKALLLMNLDKHLDAGYLLLQQKDALYSPVGVLNYSFYSQGIDAKNWLLKNAEKIQCITSISTQYSKLKPGEAQKTMLWDYADGVDTLDWLLG